MVDVGVVFLKTRKTQSRHNLSITCALNSEQSPARALKMLNYPSKASVE